MIYNIIFVENLEASYPTFSERARKKLDSKT